ncbi:MAG TPA: polysaccharide deacetylase family protein [Chitinophagaceae bacterium]|nr:polysaccharide deacetylase family protein [Chitinophagaceae bacterium]
MRTSRIQHIYILAILSMFVQCRQTSYNPGAQSNKSLTKLATVSAPRPAIPVVVKGDSSTMSIMARRQVPILCYHQIREFRTKDSERAKDYIVPPGKFEAQMKLLADSGFTTILPAQLMEYLKYGVPIPERSVMIHFDDADLSQYEVAKPVLDKYGFKACYFIMTVVLNKPGYMKREHVKQLSDEGHVIGSHTWDHMNVKKMEEKDWAIQVEKPSRQLSEITGKPVEYFAYPFGLWNEEVANELDHHGFKAAFQLSEKRDSSQPLYTIRRVIIPGQWDAGRMYKFMKGSFH